MVLVRTLPYSKRTVRLLMIGFPRRMELFGIFLPVQFMILARRATMFLRRIYGAESKRVLVLLVVQNIPGSTIRLGATGATVTAASAALVRAATTGPVP